MILKMTYVMVNIAARLQRASTDVEATENDAEEGVDEDHRQYEYKHNKEERIEKRAIHSYCVVHD